MYREKGRKKGRKNCVTEGRHKFRKDDIKGGKTTLPPPAFSELKTAALRRWCVPALVHIRERPVVFGRDNRAEDAGGGNDDGR